MSSSYKFKAHLKQAQLEHYHELQNMKMIIFKLRILHPSANTIWNRFQHEFIQKLIAKEIYENAMRNRDNYFKRDIQIAEKNSDRTKNSEFVRTVLGTYDRVLSKVFKGEE